MPRKQKSNVTAEIVRPQSTPLCIPIGCSITFRHCPNGNLGSSKQHAFTVVTPQVDLASHDTAVPPTAEANGNDNTASFTTDANAEACLQDDNLQVMDIDFDASFGGGATEDSGDVQTKTNSTEGRSAVSPNLLIVYVSFLTLFRVIIWQSGFLFVPHT